MTDMLPALLEFNRPAVATPEEVSRAEGQEAPFLWARKDKPTLAFRRLFGASPGVVYLQGLASDMEGTKATFIEYFARLNGLACLRQDYRGLGNSEGEYITSTIGEWFEDAIDCFDALTRGPQIIVASSMGAWLATLLTLARPDRVKGLLFLAPALDFTEALIKPTLGEEQRAALDAQGWYERVPGVRVSKVLLEEGKQWTLLDKGPVAVRCPVRIIHGLDDRSVPWDHAQKIANAFETKDLHLERIQDAGHRLSSSRELIRLMSHLRDLAVAAGGNPRCC